MSAQCPHASPPREHSPVLFTQHDQRPFTVSDMISFGVSDGKIDNSPFFLVASEAEAEVEVLSGSVNDPDLLP